MNLSVVMSLVDSHRELAKESLQQLKLTACGEPEYHVILSTTNTDPGGLEEFAEVHTPGRVLSTFESTYLASQIAGDNHVMVPHADTLVWTEGWDLLFQDAFDKDEQLGMAGVFGAPGMETNGMRCGPMGRMMGKRWGINWQPHGGFTPDEGFPSAILDGMIMVFRAGTIQKHLDMRYTGLYGMLDLETCPAWIEAGWRIRTLPIEVDHGGGGSYGDPAFMDAVEKQAVALGINDLPREPGKIMDFTGKLHGAIWMEKWSKKLPLWVAGDYTVKWGR